MSRMITVSLLERGAESRWDSFVDGQPEATFFHLSRWRAVIEKTFGHRTYYLTAKRGADIQGILPLTYVRSWLFGNSLVSNAFCVQGGIVARDDEVADALRSKALEIARHVGARHIEFRAVWPTSTWPVTRDQYAVFRRNLDPDAEKNMRAIPRKQRAVLRKAINNGLSSQFDDEANRLHHIYAASVRRLGTPVFPLRYFRNLRTAFGESCSILTVCSGEQPLASVMNFYFRDQVLPYYGGGLEQARRVGANDFMYWGVMCDAAQRGYRIFDFGRSKAGSGSYDYKRNWGFEPQPLAYEKLSLDGAQPRDLSPHNPRYRLAIQIWSRLPLGITKIVGPLIVRSIG